MNQPSLGMYSPAELDKLGTFVREFSTGSRRHKITLTIFLIFLVLFFGLALFIMVGGLGSGAGTGWIIPTLVFAGLAIFPGIGVVALLGRFRWKVFFFENGFIMDRGNQQQLIPWRNVRYYFEKLIFVHGVESDHMVILELAEGGKCHFDSLFRDIAVLAKYLKQHLSHYLLSAATESIQHGKDVPFGQLTLSQHGLEFKGKQIAWRDLGNVALEPSGNGYRLVIRQKGEKKPWFSRGVPAFPNVEVFLRLASRFMESA